MQHDSLSTMLALKMALLTFLPLELKDYSESDFGIDDELRSAVIFVQQRKQWFI